MPMPFLLKYNRATIQEIEVDEITKVGDVAEAEEGTVIKMGSSVTIATRQTTYVKHASTLMVSLTGINHIRPKKKV